VDSRVLRSHTLANLLERYAATIVPRKRSVDRERYMLRVVLRHPMARLSLHRLTPAEVARYRDDRLAVVSGDTVRRELAVVRHCLEVACQEWGFVLPGNPVRQIKLPRPSNPRERRATAGELERLLAACEVTSSRWLPAVIQLAVETGMRRSELLAMRWADVDMVARTVLLRNTKNGLPRTVPLSPRALEIIRDTPRFGDTVFTVSANALRLAWQRLMRRAEVSGLRFHDLRHEAVSRFFEKGLNMPEVAAISGHRDPRMLSGSRGACRGDADYTRKSNNNVGALTRFLKSGWATFFGNRGQKRPPALISRYPVSLEPRDRTYGGLSAGWLDCNESRS
jgi:integrase